MICVFVKYDNFTLIAQVWTGQMEENPPRQRIFFRFSKTLRSLQQVAMFDKVAHL